jgi:hypothetical protein
MKLHLDGWRIADEKELEIVGLLFRNTLESHLPRLLGQFMAFDGWVSHFRDMIDRQAAGRGVPWSMLGYALLASGCSFEDIRQVLASHSQEDGSRGSSNRVDKHLEKQRSLVFERFGVMV